MMLTGELSRPLGLSADWGTGGSVPTKHDIYPGFVRDALYWVKEVPLFPSLLSLFHERTLNFIE